jgi:hypothetical protein
MANPYFRQVPNFDYISRSSDLKSISDYTEVKNLFRRGKLREDIADSLLYFTKYEIIGDERPDNVAFKFYNDETLDWVVLLSNNILNIQSEWPLTQNVFDKIMLDKYKSYNNFYNGIHHYETKEVKNSLGKIVLKSGITLPNNWETDGGFVNENGVIYFEFFDPGTSSIERVYSDNLLTPITYYQYELELENKKRSIFVLKPRYLTVVFNDMDNIMTYKKGSEQFVSQTLKRGENIRLYN